MILFSLFIYFFPSLLIHLRSHFQNYAVTLAEQLGVRGPKTASKFGRDLEEQALDKFRDDQIAQLYELMLAAKNIESEEDKKSWCK